MIPWVYEEVGQSIFCCLTDNMIGLTYIREVEDALHIRERSKYQAQGNLEQN